MKAGLAGQFLRFGVVGVAGLCVDLAVLFLLAPLLGWYAGRVGSFLAAATATWALNRRITFTTAKSPGRSGTVMREYLRYLTSMLGGAALNYGTYLLVLHLLPGRFAPALGVALGSCAGLLANFAAARRFVFRPAATSPMRQLQDWPRPERANIVGVLTDIDDTLTTDGAITADALQALAQLRAAGLHVIGITGRPVGWSEPFARSWPLDAIVAENGSVALVQVAPADASSHTSGTLKRLYAEEAENRARNFARLQQVAQRVLREVPGAMLSRDSPGRETDIAIDHSEFTQLDADNIARAVAIMQSEGMSATVSSIHINGWFGGHNKLVGARWIVRELLGRELDTEMDRWVYVGDSTNDQLMFEAFPHSVGVANIRRFEAELTHFPRYITQGERGAGFAEVASALLASRTGGA